MQFRSLSFLFLTLTAGAVAAAGACQSPDQFLRDGGAMTGRAGAGGGVFAGNAGSTGSGSGGHAGGGGSTFAGTAGTTGGGAGGSSAGSTGTDGGAGGTGPQPCPNCQVLIEYTCRSTDDQTISFVLRPINNASTAIPLSNLTIRYWFTTNGITPTIDCDYAAIKGLTLNCDNIVHKPPATSSPTTFHAVTPALPTADQYVEIGFDSAAGTLDGFHAAEHPNDDQLQFRIHDVNYARMTQTDDYSFNCADGGSAEIESQLITAYVGGVLKFGTEPQ